MGSDNTPLTWYPGHELLLPRIVRAENCHLFDERGRRYVDLESGVWCTVVGHRHPRIRRALHTQFDRMAHSGFGYSCEIVAQAAEELLSLLDFDGGRCVFLCSGSEAVEYAVRVAQIAAPRPRLLTFEDAYLGAYGLAHRKTAAEWVLFDWLACADCHGEKSCDASCERWASIPFDTLGGFFFEPGSSGGLVRFPPRKLIDRIVAAVRDRGGLVAVNEVTTGMGRTGAWFGHQHYVFAPDIVALGKGLGNGYPVSATAVAPHVVTLLGGRELAYAQSHQNDPLGAAVAREVIAVLRDGDLVARGRRIGAHLAAELAAIRARTGRIATTRSRGLMLAVELKKRGGDFTTKLHRDMVRRGYLLGRRPGIDLLRLDPALTIAREDIDGFLATFETALMADEGAREH